MQSSQNVSDGLRRARIAFRTTLTRPSTLVKIAGVTGLFYFWFARKTRSRPTRTAQGLWDAAAISVRGVMLANILRYGRMRLKTIFQ